MVTYIKNGKSHFDEALLDYMRKGSIKVLQSFLQNDHSSTTDSSGRTLLHCAAKSNNVSMTQYFLNNKYDIHAEDDDGYTPLMLAMENYSFETAKLLIKAGADIYYRDLEGKGILPRRSVFKYGRYPDDKMQEYQIEYTYRTIVKAILERLRKDYWNDEQLLIERLQFIECSLITAICLGDANVTRLMLENGYSVDEIEEQSGETALHEAVRQGDFENVKVLLKYGANVHAQNKEGNLSPIYYYDDHNQFQKVTDQRMKILKILIDHGALSLTPQPNRSNPANVIISNGKLSAINIVMQSDGFEWDPSSSLLGLVFNQNPDVLEAIRGMKIDFDSINNPHKAPVLSLAAIFGELSKLQFLLESGANPNVVGKDELTPLMCLCDFLLELSNQQFTSLYLLLQYGADAQLTCRGEQTVFDLAIQRGQLTVLDSIIAHLAMIESLGVNITLLIRKKIDSQETFRNKYALYKGQIERMKSTTICESVTLFKLLTDSQSKITRYARNQELESNFRKFLKIRPSLELYYLIALERRVGKAILLAKLKEEAAVVLNKIVGCHIKNYYEIFNEIIDYLTCDDLKNLCNVYDLQDSDSYNLETLFI